MEKARERSQWLKWISVIVGVLSAVVIFCIRDVAVGFYNVPDSTKELASQMLIVLCFLVFFISISAVGVVGILRGGGDARFALFCDLTALWLVAVPAGLLAAFVFHAPVLVVYGCTKVDEVVKDVMVLWRLRNGNWIKNVTRDYGAHTEAEVPASL